MKTCNLFHWNLLTFATLLLLMVPYVEANPARAVKYADDALPLIPILFGMFGNLAGLAATIGSGIWARGKEESKIVPSAIVAAIGGVWCAVAWFGWPMAKTSSPVFRSGGMFSPGGYDYVETSEFSFFRLIGLGIFAIIGLVAWAAIAFSSKDKQNG